MREQRERARAERERDELRGKLKTLETEGDPFKRAAALWKEKKYTQAIKTGFNAQKFDDDLLVQLAGAEDDPEPLTPEQLREQIKQELEDQRQAQEAAQAQQLQQLRQAAVQEVGAVLVASPDKWPTVWALGITGAQLAAALDASFDPKTGRTLPPEQLFDELEKEARAKIQGLPYYPRTGEPTPAPRSFGQESRRGPVDAPDPAKPLTFRERQEQRAQRELEWRERTFRSQS